MIDGLFETHINVTHLERSMQFYGEVLGLELGIIDEARRIAFYWVGARGEAMLGVWEKPKDQVLPQHFAFRSSIEAILERSAAYLEARHLSYHNFLNDDTKRPQVFGWMPAVAIYFDDPDGHSLEFIAMLPEPARPEVGVVSWETWQALRSLEQNQD